MSMNIVGKKQSDPFFLLISLFRTFLLNVEFTVIENNSNVLCTVACCVYSRINVL